jgi:hypothetical protein
MVVAGQLATGTPKTFMAIGSGSLQSDLRGRFSPPGGQIMQARRVVGISDANAITTTGRVALGGLDHIAEITRANSHYEVVPFWTIEPYELSGAAEVLTVTTSPQ